MPVRILVADDNSFVRKNVRKLLEGPGREIIEAENGQQAIALALEHRPQVAVFDLAMPVMDGLTAARHLHNDLPELPILMYTMHWSSQLEVETIKSGIKKVIAKADSAGLIAAVNEVVGAVPADSLLEPAALPVPDLPPVVAAIETASAPAEAVAAEAPPAPDVPTVPSDDPADPQP